METIHYLLHGFSIAFQPENILLVFLGCLFGTLVGVLPGIGPVATIAILLPITFKMSSVGAIIMLAGIYYGAQYGGSITSVLLNVPGELTAVVTTFDGYQMARKGRAGAALGIAAFGSFIAGTLSVAGLMLLAQPLSRLALRFGPPEYSAIIILTLTFVVYFAKRSVIKAYMMACVGFIMSNVGLDPVDASQRLTFNQYNLIEGLNIAPMAIGLFGISEVIVNLEKSVPSEILKTKVKNLFPTKIDWIRSKWSILRGTIIGFFFGTIPGCGPVFSSFLSYGVEKKISKTQEEFGQGAIEGVAGPESANNAGATGAFIPLLTLGIPPSATLALIFGALILHGVTPGPFLITKHPDLFWGVISSMYIGNIMLLILNLPLIPLWVQVLKVPAVFLYPLIILFCLVGCYSINNNMLDVYMVTIFGIVGYLLRKFDFDLPPLVLAFVLGGLLETNARQSLLISDGSFSIFITRPISLVILVIVFLLIVLSIVPLFRETIKSEGDEIII